LFRKHIMSSTNDSTMMETRQPHYAKAPASREIFDGKRMRKAVVRRTVDFNNSSMRWMLDRPGQDTEKDVPVGWLY
jgi:hypothetical protein